MRSLIVITMFVASLTHAAWNGYTEDRSLELDADGVSRLDIDAGAGSLVVTGAAGASKIEVTATINVPDEDDALEIIEKRLRLSLDKADGEARLEAYFDNNGWSWGDSPSVDLDVRVPHGLELFVDDSSGSLEIMDSQSVVEIDDGSGSIKVAGVTSLVIDDGSGSIKVKDVAGDVEIEDGSGSITIEKVGGGVTIDDGSGSIDVDDVELDLVIVDDGSGGLDATNVRGDVINDS
jgi:hypothetical protein